MVTIRGFDPALCSSTGVCDVEVDQQRVAFAADIDWLRKRDVSVERLNLVQQPQAFAADVAICRLLEAQGEAALPAATVDGRIRRRRGFPSRDQLAAWAGIAPAPSVFTEQVAELVAIGASEVRHPTPRKYVGLHL